MRNPNPEDFSFLNQSFHAFAISTALYTFPFLLWNHLELRKFILLFVYKALFFLSNFLLVCRTCFEKFQKIYYLTRLFGIRSLKNISNIFLFEPTWLFGRSVNPIPTRGADSAHPLLLLPPNFFTFWHSWTQTL